MGLKLGFLFFFLALKKKEKLILEKKCFIRYFHKFQNFLINI